MALDWITISLRGWASDRTTGSEFFDALGMQPKDGYEVRPGDRPGKSALVQLVNIEKWASATEVADELIRAAGWLRARPPGVFDGLRAAGLKMDVFVDGWIDGDQMDLRFPAEFLLACGQAGLAIEIITND